MGRVSVVIPTAARPETLETTLRAVSRQVDRELISEVIVSENLGDRRSERVAQGFPGLPIEYRFRDPAFDGSHASFDHVAALFREAKSEYVALVCDDDVWSPGHLVTAVESLDRNAQAAAHFSAFYGSESELAHDAYQWGGPLLWLAAGRPDRFSEYRFDLEQALALAWIFTPFQWSTMVARTRDAVAAIPTMLSAAHPYYADRTLILGLAERGTIVFDPAVDTLYRVYAGNWQSTQDPVYMRSLLDDSHALVCAKADAQGVDLPGAWRGYLTDIPDEMAAEVRRWMVDRFSDEELQSYGLARLLPLTGVAPASQSDPHAVPTSLRHRLVARLRGVTGQHLPG